ncbi:P-loop containing nucleoside triphosphate hydrolases superfamily protein [Tripterygium wilfordii]|uniref:P-loop containing nucleoside triphosphate hydrolases superfamily protein n=2 Tax=Tripterygium wilfordii TaxID=458696 RepID=A0A7J7CPL0_TRIWF|nr:P-loop containing nucleoside triphosphate hydrolases superfamily protein [Tripterygium wilfordii]
MNFLQSSPMCFISTFLSLSATVSAMFMLLRTIFNDFVPREAREYIASLFSDYLFSDFTFVIEDRWLAVDNETFRAVERYLPTRVGPTTQSLLLGSCDTSNASAPPKSGIPVGGKIVDHFEGMRLVWTLRCKESKKYYCRDKKYHCLTCKKQYRERVMKTYFPHVTRTAESILHHRETLNIYTFNKEEAMWESTVFKHPSTFTTLAMDPALKRSIKDDLDQFVKRKDFFESAGRAWKCGYLLYGPPGTGKSSLVAAIANYLRYNIYDLQVQSVRSDAELRRILTATTNRSILLIEDIDCSGQVAHDRANDLKPVKSPGKKPNEFSLDPGV